MLFDSSISFSGNNTKQGQFNIYLNNSVNVSNINESFSEVFGRCLFDFDNIELQSALSYSSFSNNSQYCNTIEDAYNSAYIRGSSSATFDMSFCNFLNNLGSDYYESALIYTEINAVISNCSFNGNTGNTYSFYKKSGSLIIKNCFIGDSQPNYGNPQIENRINSEYILKLSHLSTQICPAEFPLKFIAKKIKTYDKFITFDPFNFYLFASCYA